jgi:hypothetical protein
MKGGIRKDLKRDCFNRGGARGKCRGFKVGRNRGNEVRKRMTRIKGIKKLKLKTNTQKGTSRLILLPWKFRYQFPPKR